MKGNSASNAHRNSNSGTNTSNSVDLHATFSPGSSVGAATSSIPTSTIGTFTSGAKIASITVIKKTNSATKTPKTSSPTPSKKTIPAPPPPLNLMLPTWDATFHTAPRNVVPERKVDSSAAGDDKGQCVRGKLLGKTKERPRTNGRSAQVTPLQQQRRRKLEPQPISQPTRLHIISLPWQIPFRALLRDGLYALHDEGRRSHCNRRNTCHLIVCDRELTALRLCLSTSYPLA